MGQRERGLVESLRHPGSHFSGLSELVALQAPLVQGESELLIVWVLLLKVFDNLQVLCEDLISFFHSAARPLQGVHKVVISPWRILQISEHAKNFLISFLKAIIVLKAERVDHFETAKKAGVNFVFLLVYLFLDDFKGAFRVDF